MPNALLDVSPFSDMPANNHFIRRGTMERQDRKEIDKFRTTWFPAAQHQDNDFPTTWPLQFEEFYDPSFWSLPEGAPDMCIPPMEPA